MTRIDAYPERRVYVDTGCEVASSCLRCPLPQCRFETERNRGRNMAIVEAVRAGQENVAQIAYRFGISRRTVFRIAAQMASTAR